MNDWLFRSIMRSILGDEPTPARPLAKLPFVDDEDSLESALRPPSSQVARLQGAAFLKRKEQEETWKAIFGYDLTKDVTPIDQNTTYPTQRQTHLELPEPIRDPRRPLCDCMCEFCERQDCRNCCAEDRCPQSGEGLLSEIMDIGEAVREVFRQAARDRARQSKLDQHKKALRPMVRAFRNEFPYRSVKIDEAVDRVVDAAADYVADVTATV